MSEFRQDIVNKNWVLIAESRSQRPNETKFMPAVPGNLPEHDASCDFCVGNDKGSAAEIAKYPKRGEWQVRVVPNKYEAIGHTPGSRHINFYNSRPGIGDHEVVITRPHNQPLALQDVGLIDLTLTAYMERISDLMRHDEVGYVHIR